MTETPETLKQWADDFDDVRGYVASRTRTNLYTFADDWGAQLAEKQARIEELEKRLEAAEKALEDSTSLLRTIHDEDDEGGIAAQIADNDAALKEANDG